MKDLEWLKEQVKNHIEPYDEEDWLSYSAGCTDVAELILGYIDQVEQPELPEITEEQAWEVLSNLYDIPNHSFIRVAMKVVAKNIENTTTIAEIKSKFEQPGLPIIPGYVAEYIEREKENCSHWFEVVDELGAAVATGTITKQEQQVSNFIVNNADDFVDAYRYGYTVEEKKYYVLDNLERFMLKRYSGGVEELKVGSMSVDSEWFEPERYALTEQEIKDYDERFWPFAVKVEELEE